MSEHVCGQYLSLRLAEPLYWLIGGQCLVTAVGVHYRSPSTDVQQQTVWDAAWCKERHVSLTGARHALDGGVYCQSWEKPHNPSTRVTVTLNSRSETRIVPCQFDVVLQCVRFQRVLSLLLLSVTSGFEVYARRVFLFLFFLCHCLTLLYTLYLCLF